MVRRAPRTPRSGILRRGRRGHWPDSRLTPLRLSRAAHAKRVTRPKNRGETLPVPRHLSWNEGADADPRHCARSSKTRLLEDASAVIVWSGRQPNSGSGGTPRGFGFTSFDRVVSRSDSLAVLPTALRHTARIARHLRRNMARRSGRTVENHLSDRRQKKDRGDPRRVRRATKSRRRLDGAYPSGLIFKSLTEWRQTRRSVRNRLLKKASLRAEG